MKIDVVLTATNPLSLNYNIFFSTIESWEKIADEIIWVDGGTDDDTYSMLSKKVKKKLLRISNGLTNWDIHYRFSPNHINTMINQGIKTSNADWLFIAWGDYVLEKSNRKDLEKELRKYESENWVKYKRRKVFIIDKNFDTQALIDIILNTDRELIKDVNIFDVYEGEKIPNDKKSIALNVNIQSMHKPLNETNLEKLNNLIIFNVEKKTGAKIRS